MIGGGGSAAGEAVLKALFGLVVVGVFLFSLAVVVSGGDGVGGRGGWVEVDVV